ncbi:MAG: ATP-dependent metallopeptidase FtsH/Yme1/Tma family protein [Glycomyces artemisiae]|uniref:ATP-dependent zinc metalloprotease FtsH n=1 Tax=Glycomyces artemisiae TaxID=1076443 RepID=A0A2T0UM78_9ACTN|nr:ATP-dependent zinc metalloprotease FtsH [Glycomyces artemisiae]NUQ89299.1 ATP-dependent metallopeptidase FtsH/Yme1/Tma family protein [Glycomyces artemisiae]PRY59020.1 cell division protease FtsH [Glycomyces artemisiae]
MVDAGRPTPERKRFFRRPLVWIVLIALIAVLIGSFWSGGSDYDEATTSEVLKDINDGNVKEANLLDKEQLVQLTLTSGDQVEAYLPAGMMETVATELEDAGVKFDTEVNETSVFVSFLLSLLPIVLIVLLLLFFMSQMQGGGSRVLNFGKSKAKMVSKDTPKTTFDDVAGADEAVEELREIKDFLEDPKKYQELGAKIPKGVLLFGPPGTGKTLLARAVAGEAGVPFYSISGSDFVEMFVGVGASRVRDLFTQAKENAPAIVFVDEIDAVGRHRGAGMGGGHDEREQTLNQLLVEMDGFDTRGGVILIAATNRPDILDPALLRPGRFDRQIPVDAPDKEGRQAILAVHAKGKPFVPNVEFETIARRTPGFSGADLENVINEAALLTARHNEKAISADALEEAIDRVIAGPERKGRVMGDAEKKMTAYHESGHALVAHALPHAAPVHKLTILPRGRSLGHTLVLPTEDKYTQTRSEMIDTLAYALGGRAAEELVYHDPTTGASDDISKATKVARAMVTEYGMSSKLGAVKYGSSGSEPFLGREYGHQKDYSDEIAALVDAEVRALIEIAHDEAYAIVTEYRDVLDQMVTELLEKETLNQEDLERIASRVVKRPPMSPFNGTDKRKLGQPPVSTPNGSRPADGPDEGIEVGPGTEGQTPLP